MERSFVELPVGGERAKIPWRLSLPPLLSTRPLHIHRERDRKPLYSIYIYRYRYIYYRQMSGYFYEDDVDR